MASIRNKHGLSRDIPDGKKRLVRQECGFGCVVCGASITEYEHIDPQFADAQEHDPRNIALLCNSCHGQVTRKFWSKKKVSTARMSPFCKQTGFSRGEFDLGKVRPTVKFAGVLLRSCPVPVAVKGVPLIRIDPPEEAGGPFRLSASFSDAAGVSILEIRENEWRGNASNWDTEFTGGKIIIRQSSGDQCLVLRALPPDGIGVEKLHMISGGIRFEGDADSLRVLLPDGPRTLTGCVADSCEIGLAV